MSDGAASYQLRVDRAPRRDAEPPNGSRPMHNFCFDVDMFCGLVTRTLSAYAFGLRPRSYHGGRLKGRRRTPP